MDGSEDARQGVIFDGDADDMDVVRHEAIGPDFEFVLPGILGEPFQIAGVILRHGEHGLPVIAPLGDMVGVTYGYGTGYSRHRSSLGWTERRVKEIIGALSLIIVRRRPGSTDFRNLLKFLDSGFRRNDEKCTFRDFCKRLL